MSTTSSLPSYIFFMPTKKSILHRILVYFGWNGREYSRAELEIFLPIFLRVSIFCSMALMVVTGYIFFDALQSSGLIRSFAEPDMNKAIIEVVFCFLTFFLLFIIDKIGKNITMLSMTSDLMPRDLRNQHKEILVALIQNSTMAENYYQELTRAGLRLRLIDLHCMKHLQEEDQLLRLNASGAGN